MFSEWGGIFEGLIMEPMMAREPLLAVQMTSDTIICRRWQIRRGECTGLISKNDVGGKDH